MLKGKMNEKSVGFVELGEAVHNHRAHMNVKHGCALIHIKFGKLRNSH